MTPPEPRPTDLRDELASLRIDREPAPRSGSRWPLVLLAAAVLAGGLWYARSRNAPVVVQTAVATRAATGSPRAGTSMLSASGYLVARKKAVVSAKIQGRLSELRVEEGSRVREGDLLARLESTDYQAQVQRARADLQRAQADAQESERQMQLARRLAGEQIVSRDQLDAAESRVRVSNAGVAQARAGVGFAEASLQNTRILAPFSGTVVKKMAEVGESVAPIPPGVNLSTSSGAVVALADLDTLEVEADVSESNVAKLSAGQPAEVTVEAVPDRTYKARLRQIIPTADRTKATVQVKVAILDHDDHLRPEMSAKVTFLAPEPAAAVAGAEEPRRAVTAPAEAVVTRDGKAVVYEVQDGVVHARSVDAAPARSGQVEIRSGLSGGELLVVSPPANLKDGQRVAAAGK